MERHGAKIMICVTIAIWSFFLLKDSHTSESRPRHDKWTAMPSVDVFDNYEGVQKYITEKESRSSKQLANPLDDSYIRAYNYHHEGPVRFLVKRGTEAVDSPKIFKFEVSDAREPDEATKQLIRLHRGRELELLKDAANLPMSKRTKRQITEPKLIRFEISDAKEPDEVTKELIRKSRARQLVSTTTKRAPTTKTTRVTQSTTRKVTRKRKRTRRAAQKTEPHFIRFELEDAKEPDSDFRDRVNQMRQREMHFNPPSNAMNRSSNETNTENDSSSEESKRFFFYHAAPAKTKRIANAVPTEVQKIIEMMLKDNKAQAYYKYIANLQDNKLKVLGKIRPIYGPALASAAPTQVASAPVAENLVTVYPEQAYVQKLVPIPVPVHTFPIALLPPPQLPATAASPHQLVVPATPNKQPYYHTIAPAQQHQASVYQQPESYVKIIPAVSQVFHELPVIQQHHHHQSATSPTLNSLEANEIPKRYSYAKVIPLESSYRYGRRLNFYPSVTEAQQSISTDNQAAPEQAFKIEPQQIQQVQQIQHSAPQQQPLEVNGNSISEAQPHHQQQQQQPPPQQQRQPHQQQVPLEDMQEFQELSALIGKSPTDQIHGLAYLLAKEMQRSKRLKGQRPQDNTSPILFHPEKNAGVVTAQEYADDGAKSLESQAVKDYTPIVEQSSHVTQVNQLNPEPVAAVATPPPPPPPTSYAVLKTLGLSPNYKGIEQYEAASAVHPDTEDGRGLQYASKYAFGYRVRDFHSGNDFGHKQNQDLDGVTRGQYHILLPDGRIQNVIYHADDTGFHADVVFETGHR